MKKQKLTIIWYDKKSYKIPITNRMDWFNGERGSSHCVIGCYNTSDVFYISDYGTASIGYCSAHAEVRILRSMLAEHLERGIWCSIYNGKLRPHDYYYQFMQSLKKINPEKAKKLKAKLDSFKKSLSYIRGIHYKTKEADG